MLDPDKRPSRATANIIEGHHAMRHSFRCGGGLPDVVGGFPLTGGINSLRAAAGRSAIRLGPDEWLLLSSTNEDLDAVFSQQLPDRFYSLVDVSHRYENTIIEGEQTEDILGSACALDLDVTRFPVGFATRTSFGKSEIILARPQSNRFEIESARSFTAYVRDLLSVCAGDVADRGLRPLP